MKKPPVPHPIVHRPLLWWVLLPANRKPQLMLLGIVLVTVAMRLVPLEMQKRIVDEGILGRNARLLTLYCAVYLAAFLSASGLKYAINALQTMIGQRTLARMRREMFAHIVHLPYGFFRNTQPGAVIATLLNELATAGDFIGLAVAVPATNLLTLMAFGVYLFRLNPLLAAISFAIYPVVVVVIPFLQKRVNRYNRKRVIATRRVSGKIGEVMAGLQEIKTGNAYEHEERRFARLVERLCRIRIVWNLYRFGVKVVSNLLINFSRFLIFGLGGYLALEGNLALGSLVAFLSAQEKLYDPWKEMIGYYQAYQTAVVTYRRAMQTYDAIGEKREDVAATSPKTRLSGDVRMKGVGFRTAEGATLLEDITLDIESGDHWALVGASGSGKSTLAHCLVGLISPSQGHIRIGGRDTAELSRRELSRTMAFVPQEPFVFRGTIADNLYYPSGPDQPAAEVCYTPPQRNETIEVLQQVGLFIDVLGFGLENPLGDAACEEFERCLVSVRRRLAASLDPDLAAHVERFDPDRFLRHASLAENLLFGRVVDEKNFGHGRLAARSEVVELLAETGLLEPLLDVGRTIMNELADYLRRPPIPEDIQRLLPLDTERIRIGLGLLDRDHQAGGMAGLGDEEKEVLLTVALACIPVKFDRLELKAKLQRDIVALRPTVQKRLGRQGPIAISFYREDGYIENAAILTNILFGYLTTDDDATQGSIREAINRALIENELLEAIVGIGLQHAVGTAGKNLSGGQRQKLAIARALMKQPSVLVFDEATSSLDQASQSRVQDVLVRHWKGRSTLIAIIHRMDILHHYDRVAVMQEGRIIESGSYEALMAKKGGLYGLVSGGEVPNAAKERGP